MVSAGVERENLVPGGSLAGVAFKGMLAEKNGLCTIKLGVASILQLSCSFTVLVQYGVGLCHSSGFLSRTDSLVQAVGQERKRSVLNHVQFI